MESATAQLATRELDLSYTEIRAPFAGLIVTRYIKLAQHVSTNTPLFRISDFTPLLCPIQVPEKDLATLGIGQPAHLRVEAFPDEQFSAEVLRVSPTVDAATGTIKVTLEVDGRGRLRPGMFASVFLVTDRHDDALVIPRTALVLDSIGDTVFVREGDLAARREVKLGFRESELVEVLEGIDDQEEVIVLGQDGLSNGTPIEVLAATAVAESAPPADREPPVRSASGAGEPSAPPGSGQDQPQREQRAAEAQPGAATAAGGEAGPRMGRPGQEPPAGQGQPGMGRTGERPGQGMGQRPGGPGGQRRLPPQVIEMIKNATPEQLEMFKQRMRQRGMSEEQIEERLRQIRESDS
jgi:hypothetical protein